MKTRWHFLAGSSLAALVGTAWLADRFGMPLLSWVSVWLVGLCGSATIATWAAVIDLRARWPAAIALICAAPAGQLLMRELPDAGGILRQLGAPFLMVFLGILGTIGGALAILLGKVPPRDALAPARARR